MRKYSIITLLLIFITIPMWNCNSYRKHFDLGKWYYNKGLLDEAILEFNTVAKTKPDFHEAHYFLAIAFTKKGWYDYAIKEAEIAFRLHPCDDYYELIQIIKRKSELERLQETPTSAAK